MGSGRKNKSTEPLFTALDESSLLDVKSGAWTWPAVLISSLAFTLGHTSSNGWQLLPTACLFPVMGKKGGSSSCIVAHGTTNLVLAIFVFMTGQWGFW